MRPKDRALAQTLDEQLRSFDREVRELPGIKTHTFRMALIEQLIESIRRVRYFSAIRARSLSGLRADPASELFDPIRAALVHHRQGRIEEAFWLVFLSVHFGKHIRDGWRLARDIYGRMGQEEHWDWGRVSADPARFREWLAASQNRLKNDGICRRFGNHRKYESLDAHSPHGTGAVVESYVRWVNPPRTHQMLIRNARKQCSNEPRSTFNHLYHSMASIARFGRLARFDYLTSVGKLGLAAVEPGSTYMQGATGPLNGGRLLFAGTTVSALRYSEIDAWLMQLADHLKLEFGMQILEDALCNWQKSPDVFIPYRG